MKTNFSSINIVVNNKKSPQMRAFYNKSIFYSGADSGW